MNYSGRITFASVLKQSKKITMKKVFGLLVVAAAFAACGGENKEATADTTAAPAVDTTAVAPAMDTTAAAADTTAKVDTAAKAH